jgi:hypothetical protein
LNPAPAFDVWYGYRFNHLFQADAGLQMAFLGPNNQNPEVTDFGTIQGGDHEFMIPLGGRLILPLGMRRLEASPGGYKRPTRGQYPRVQDHGSLDEYVCRVGYELLTEWLSGLSLALALVLA